MGSAVDELINSNTSDSPVSFYDYFNAYGSDKLRNAHEKGDPYSFKNKVMNFFYGTTTSAEKEYQNYLSDFEYKRNAEATAKANMETWAREDSQIQLYDNLPLNAEFDYLHEPMFPY